MVDVIKRTNIEFSDWLNDATETARSLVTKHPEIMHTVEYYLVMILMEARDSGKYKTDKIELNEPEVKETNNIVDLLWKGRKVEEIQEYYGKN